MLRVRRQRQNQDTGTSTRHGSRKLRCHEILNLLIEFHNSPAAAAPHLASWWRPAVPGVDAAAAVNDTGHSSQLIYSRKIFNQRFAVGAAQCGLEGSLSNYHPPTIKCISFNSESGAGAAEANQSGHNKLKLAATSRKGCDHTSTNFFL